MNDLISVIIPMYNKEKCVMKCLKSLINQTYTNFELIVVNDGSTDGSVQIVNQINDKRIKLFEIENSGVSNARNYGLNKAKGKYIAFVDPDDYVSEKYLEDMIIKMSDDVDLTVTGRIEICRNISRTSEKINYYGSINEIPKKFYMDGYCHPIWGKLFRKQIIDKNKIKFKSIAISEDSFFNLEYLIFSKKIRILPICNYYYVKYDGNDNLTNKCDFSYIEIYNKLYKKYNYFFKDKPENYAKDIIYPQYYNLLIKLIKKYPITKLYKNSVIKNNYDCVINVLDRSNDGDGIEKIICYFMRKKYWIILKLIESFFKN